MPPVLKSIPFVGRVGLGFLLLIGAGAAAGQPALPKPPPPPNIVLMLADDLGYGDLRSYGGPDIRTPHLDRLAERGARFTQAYAAFPVCSPSRAALLTGRYVHRFGPSYEDYFGGGSPGLDPQRHPTLARLLKDAGYATGCFGKWNVSNSARIPANAFGFDRWVGLHLNHDFYTHRLLSDGSLDLYADGQPLERPGVWSDTLFADEAVEFIRRHSKERPFFVFLPWQAPHDPIQDPDIPFDAPKKNLAEHRAIYAKMVERLDREVGRVLAALEETGAAKNTLILFTSDNGAPPKIGRNDPLRGAKQELWEGGIRVPLLVAWPGQVPAARVIDTPVISMDLTATIAAAAGVTPPAGAAFDGLDLRPVLTGTGTLPDERPLFWRRRMVDIRQGEDSIRQSAVRAGDWKYLRTYAFLGQGRFGDTYREALFNLRLDPSETNDQVAHAPAELARLRTLFVTWEQEVDREAATAPGPIVPKTRKSR
jgi:arylsulfatase A